MDALTFDEVVNDFAPAVAHSVYRRYARYGVAREDLLSELYVFLYGTGKPKVERWLKNNQLIRLRRELTDVARSFGEKEKAQKLGYDTEDIQWYTPAMVEALMPLALDETFTGVGEPDTEERQERSERKSNSDPAEAGNLLAAVMDIRRALSGLDPWVRETFELSDSSYPSWNDAVEAVVQFLGGPKPFVGKRRAISNARAQAETGSEYDG